jgi:mRNA interferase RelE/StbE
MPYAISILRRAQKELTQLPPGAYEQVRDALFSLAHEPRPPGCIKLTARNGWRTRIGDYRIVYEIEEGINSQHRPQARYLPVTLEFS